MSSTTVRAEALPFCCWTVVATLDRGRRGASSSTNTAIRADWQSASMPRMPHKLPTVCLDNFALCKICTGFLSSIGAGHISFAKCQYMALQESMLGPVSATQASAVAVSAQWCRSRALAHAVNACNGLLSGMLL